MQLALIIAFECQFEPPPSPLEKKNRLYTLKLKTGISHVELHKSGHGTLTWRVFSVWSSYSMKQENTISSSGKESFRSKDYRFSRVYLLRFSKGQSGPRDIDLNNNYIGRHANVCQKNDQNCLAKLCMLRPEFNNAPHSSIQLYIHKQCTYSNSSYLPFYCQCYVTCHWIIEITFLLIMM